MNFTLLLILAMIAWGISWPIAKITTHNTPPEVLIFWRNGATTLALLPLLYFYKNHLSISKKAFLSVLSGAFLMSVYNYLFFAGLRDGLAGLGGVIVTTVNPLLNYFILILFGLHKISKNEVLGLGMGLLGGVFLLNLWTIDIPMLLKGGNLYFIIASLFWAVLTIVSSKSKNLLHPIVFSFYVYLLSTILTAPTAIVSNFMIVMQNDKIFWWGIFYLSAISTGFGTTVYFISSTKLGSQKASSFIFMVPGTAIFSSWFFLDEIPGWSTIVGGTLAMLAVKILQSGPSEEISEPS
jgi:drug/metabolite transporter (DMT)-like permease